MIQVHTALLTQGPLTRGGLQENLVDRISSSIIRTARNFIHLKHSDVFVPHLLFKFYANKLIFSILNFSELFLFKKENKLQIL